MSLDIAPFLAVGLDVSFANVNLAEAKLMLVGAQDDVTAAFAQLAAALGYQDNRFFSLPLTSLHPGLRLEELVSRSRRLLATLCVLRVFAV